MRNPTILLCLVVALASHDVSLAEEKQPLEYEVKAAFLLNFTKFTEWPDSAFAGSDSPIAICVLGNNAFGNTLAQMVNGEIVNGRKLIVERIKHVIPPKTCQVLFIGEEGSEAVKLLPSLGSGVLSVGEGESFIREGGIITFVVENRRVRFDINRRLAASAGVKISSKLLKVARSVEN